MDAVLLARAVGDDRSLTDAEYTVQSKNNSNVKYDGKVDFEDLSLLMRYLAKIIPYTALGQQ